VIALVALVAVLGGAWLWLRDSSLVAVRRVQVAGASGPDAAQIRSALIAAARNMTTLDVKMKQLRMAVAPYPVVKSLNVDTQFPHGMRIHVVEQVPVARVEAGGRRTAVSGDGTLLHDNVASQSLPTISLGVPPGGTHLTGYALSEVHLLAAAPYQLLARVSQVSDGPAHGLVAQLRNGPSIYFGDSHQLGAKWTAAAEVLADSGSAGAAYLDVTDPSRPAAGAGSDSTGAATTGATAAAATDTTGAASTDTTAAAATDTTAAGSTDTSSAASADTAGTVSGATDTASGAASPAPTGTSVDPAGG
jgi:cell division septal protein FtsQ